MLSDQLLFYFRENEHQIFNKCYPSRKEIHKRKNVFGERKRKIAQEPTRWRSRDTHAGVSWVVECGIAIMT